MTKLKPKIDIKKSIYIKQTNKAAIDRLLTLSILMDISIEAYTSEIIKTELKKKEIEL